MKATKKKSKRKAKGYFTHYMTKKEEKECEIHLKMLEIVYTVAPGTNYLKM